MGVAEILAAIDHDIGQLQAVRAVLSGNMALTPKKKVGRPVTVPSTTDVSRPKPKKKRNLTPEGRKRIAEAVKRRWASQKKGATLK